MSVSICVPLMSDNAERDRNWEFVRSRYESLYPDWEIVTGGCELPWRKGLALHHAVQKASGDILVIADADVLVAEEALRVAVRRLEDVPWVVPHRMVYRLTEDATRAVIEGRLIASPRIGKQNLERVRRGAPGGGIAVLERGGWEAVNGMDPRFEGWGGEDLAFGFALDTLIGKHLRLNDQMWHLYHPPQEMRPALNGGRGRGSQESEELANRYTEANGDSVAMCALVAEHHRGMLGGGIVVTSREVYERVPLDPRFEGWGQEDESFGFALTCLAGQPRKDPYPLFHLHHPTPERHSRARGNQDGWNLRVRYYLARRHPDQMLTLIEEARESLRLAEDPMHADPPR